MPAALFAEACRLHQAGRLVDAATLYRRCLAIQPDDAGALFNLGNALKGLDRLAPAVACYRRAVVARRDFAAAHINLGNTLLALGEVSAAAASFAQALTLRPDIRPLHYALAVARQRLGHFDASAVLARRALALWPDEPEIWLALGIALQNRARFDAAEIAYRRALAIVPDLAETHLNRGNALFDHGHVSAAIAAYGVTLALRPDLTEAYNNRGTALQTQGRLADARVAHERALIIDPTYADAYSGLLICLSNDAHVDRGTLFDHHVAYGRRFGGTPAGRRVSGWSPDGAVGRPLRIGFVSADFHRATLGAFLESVWAAHDPAAVTLIGYSGTTQPNALTARLRGSCALWRSTVGVSDADLARHIQHDRIDILVDLAGHTQPNRLRLFGLKPAPLQVSWLCYWNTTGLVAMDAILMDPVAVPPGDEGWFVEQVVRLPDSRFCYTPPSSAPAVTALPMLRRGCVTFGSFNNLAKVTPDVLAVWAELLARVPNARLLLKRSNFDHADERRRIAAAFAAAGGDLSRLDLRGWSDHAAMLAEYGDVDIGLDPFPFCGGLTSCEALWMGVPVVTLAGTAPVSRQTLGFLTQIGLHRELAACSRESYLAIAAGLATDADRLAALRGGLRARLQGSPLCDANRFARHLEAALRALWTANIGPAR